MAALSLRDKAIPLASITAKNILTETLPNEH